MTTEATSARARRTMAERLQRMMAERHRMIPGYALYRVEATVPAVQYTWATSPEHAVANAVATCSRWEVDRFAPIAEAHVVDVDIAHPEEG